MLTQDDVEEVQCIMLVQFGLIWGAGVQCTWGTYNPSA